jgi:2-polyprenyl-3-methyl-5-hydroxy-6-metoxy-1,4-benzoquinol methylase
MKQLKSIVLIMVSALNLVWRLIPVAVTKRFLMFLFILESRGSKPDRGLIRLLAIEDQLQKVINERALAYGLGEHPKHRLIPYHQFFIENLQESKRILDVGCGYGAVARSIATALPSAVVVGIDNDKERYGQAINATNPSNLDFQLIDLTDFEVLVAFDAVVLSNVLEHVYDRVSVLRSLIATTRASLFLIRVPLFERHWTIPLRSELGVNFFQDSDHKVEHRVQEFRNEVKESGLVIEEIHTLWGEIWAVCRPN